MNVNLLLVMRGMLLSAVVGTSMGCTQQREYMLSGPQQWLPSGEQATGMLVTTRQTVAAKIYSMERIYWTDSDDQYRVNVDQVCNEIKSFLQSTGQWTPPELREVNGSELSPATPQEAKLKAMWIEVNEQSLAIKGEGRESIASHHYDVCRIIVGIDPVIVVESDVPTDSEFGPVRTHRMRPVEESIVFLSYGFDFGHRVPIGSRTRWFSPTPGVSGEPITLDANGRGRFLAGPHDFDVSSGDGWLTIVPHASAHE